MVKRFGPTRGAGTVIEEQEGDKAIAPGALGWAGYAGIMEKGPVGELMLISSKTELFARTGGIIPESLLPDCAQDYFSLANGAGGLALVRVTDGNEISARATLYARNADVLTPMGTLLAHNPGRWGGKALRVTGELDDISDLDETTLQLPGTMDDLYATDRLKGGYIELADVPNKRYPIVGNTDTGLVSVASDQTMVSDYDGASGTSLRFYIVLENAGKAVSFRIGDGEDSPDSEFSIEVFVDGASVKKWGNLHTDPLNARYWVNVIENDTGNFYVKAQDLWTGAHTAAVRPANVYGRIASVTKTVLTAKIHDFQISSPGGGTPTLTLGTTTDDNVAQTITITMTSATVGTAVSDKFGPLGTVTLGTLFNPATGAGGALENKWVPPFTVTAGTALAAADVLTIHYKPFVKDALIGGALYPDKANAKLESYRIIANTHKTVTVSAGSDLTVSGAPNDAFMVVVAQEMEGGADGNADVIDDDYLHQAWDTDSSPFNDIKGQNLGLIKFATPGVTSTAVQKGGVAYVEAKNHQYRYEAPANITTEQGVLALVNDTLGRSDYAVLAWPSYGYVPDPDPAFAREGRLKLVSETGMIHGREARIAVDFDGYHKAEAGIDATLPRLLKVPTGDRRLNEELLNPAGVAVIKKKQGNFVIWGDRTLQRDPNWRFKHQREQMSYYEQVLEESFDFIIFAINDAQNDKTAETALITFFQPEYVKRALRGKTFKDAAIIKVDEEINTDSTRGNGDMFAQVSLRLADTVERFIIKIGKQGIFESVA
jgi:hypothetical protein